MLAAFDAAFGRLSTNPCLGRRVGEADATRALVVRFGRGGYVVLYEDISVPALLAGRGVEAA